MTRKHYQALAKALAPFSHASGVGDQEHLFKLILQNLCNALAADNPRFNKQRFLAAVYCDQEV